MVENYNRRKLFDDDEEEDEQQQPQPGKNLVLTVTQLYRNHARDHGAGVREQQQLSI